VSLLEVVGVGRRCLELLRKKEGDSCIDGFAANAQNHCVANRTPREIAHLISLEGINSHSLFVPSIITISRISQFGGGGEGG
jgi:hypothetical protein